MSIQDEVAKRYGWMDYDHFKLNTDDVSDVWCYKAVDDVIKLEKDNAALIANMDEMLYDLLESNPIMSVYWRKKTLHLRVKEGGEG